MKRILFVCTANIARSPMAEAMFNKKMADLGLADQYQARSAGTWARDGNRAPADGQQVMAARGLDTGPHRSRVVSNEIMAGADLILTMEAGHKEALRIEFPGARAKIFMLTELVGPGYDIRDPYGRQLADYEVVAAELENLLGRTLDKILELAAS